MAGATDPLVNVFERLRIRHLAFRRAEPEEIRELEAMRLEILKTESVQSTPAYALPGVAAVAQPPAPRPLVEMKFRLMERAFNILQLNHFANAPENHGWMNLFRQWSAAAEARAMYDELKTTLSPAFRQFYENYIYDCPEKMEEQPIHHPWHRQEGRRGSGLFMDTGRTEPGIVPAGARTGEGGVSDAKGRAGRDQDYEKSADSDPSAAGGSGPNA
jgi:hypothetical protein